MLDRRQFIKFALGAIAGRAAQQLPGAGGPGVDLAGRGRVSRETPAAREMVRPLVGSVLSYDELCEIGESVDVTDGWQEALAIEGPIVAGSLGQLWVGCSIDMNKVWEHVRVVDVYGGTWSTHMAQYASAGKDRGETWQRIR